MQDRYLFRGKHGNDWLIGDLLQQCTLHNSQIYVEQNTMSSYSSGYYDVERGSIGQCTGLKDRSGQLIFEGDVIEDGMGRTGIVHWDDKNTCFISKFIHRIHRLHKGSLFSSNALSSEKIKIISNIHDRPDLLEVQNAAD